MAFLALALLVLPQVGEPEHAFVELAARPASVYVEQPIRLTIRVGVEREFLRHNLLQLFTRALDVPVQLELPWQAGLPNTIALDPEEQAGPLGSHPSFAIGEEIVRALRSKEETRAGATWVVFEIERNFLPLASGKLEIGAPVLHFAFATRFEQDLVSGSVPLDRSSALVQGKPLEIEVAPLPDEGRPAGFGNALGRFTLVARAEPLALEVGEKLELSLSIEGQGNLAHLTPPRLDSLPGLHLRGTTEELRGSTRTLRCELVPESARTREIPSIVLDFFDPEARAYRSARTQPIPLQVKAREPLGVAGAACDARPSFYLLLGGVACALLALGWALSRRLRRR